MTIQAGISTPEDSISEIESKYKSLSSQLSTLESERSNYLYTRKQELLSQLDKEVESKFGPQVRELRTLTYHAKEEFEKEKEQKSLLSQTHPYPLGTVFVEWDRNRYGSRPPHWTGRKARLEVITSESQHPLNKAYGLAKRGDLVLRLLLKNGSPGRTYIKWETWEAANRWAIEGTTLEMIQSKLESQD